MDTIQKSSNYPFRELPDFLSLKKKQVRNCIITLFVFFVFGLFSYAQITASIKGASEKWLYLQTFTLSGYQKIDSARSIDGEFIFPITARTSPGVYMIGDGKNGFDFILNEKEIRFSTSWPQMQENLKVLQSDENVVWQQYRKERDQSYLHLELLNQVLVYYNPKAAYYAITFKEFTGIQEDFRDWTDSLISVQPKSYVARYINADRKPFIPPGLDNE